MELIVEDLHVESNYLSVDGVPGSSSIHQALQNTFWEAVMEGFITAAPARKKVRRPPLSDAYLVRILEESGAHGALSLLMEQGVCEKKPGTGLQKFEKSGTNPFESWQSGQSSGALARHRGRKCKE